MNTSNFLPPPVRLSQAFEGDAGGGMSRRRFIKRTGGATVAAAIAWQSTNQMACAIGEGECSECTAINPGDFLVELGTAVGNIDHETNFSESLVEILGAGPLTLNGLSKEPYEGSIGDFMEELGEKMLKKGMGDIEDELDLEGRLEGWVGKQWGLTTREIDTVIVGAGILGGAYKIYDEWDQNGTYSVPSAILDSLKISKPISGTLGGVYFTGKIEIGLLSAQLNFNPDYNDGNYTPLLRLGDFELLGLLGVQLHCEL